MNQAHPKLLGASHPWRTLGLIVLAGLALRLLVFGYIAHNERKFYTYDSDGYDRRAMNLLRYGQFASEAEPPLTPDLDRTPVYPLFLAAVFGSVGHTPGAVVLLQLLVGSLTAALAYGLARELGLSTGTGLLAALLVALDPVSALTANRLLTETLFTALLIAGLWLLARYWRTAQLRWAAAAAVALALTALTRPISQFLPVMLLPLLVVALRQAGWRRTLAGAALFLGLSLSLTYSWAYRNYLHSGLFTLSTISETNLIYYRARAVLAEAENTSQEAAWKRLQDSIDAQIAAQGLGPAEAVALQRQEALRVFAQHPLLTAKMLLKGVGRMAADPGYTIVCTLLDRNSTAFDCFPGRSTMNEPGLVGRVLGRLSAMSAVQVTALVASVLMLGTLYTGAALGLLQLVRERRWLTLALLLLVIGYFVGLAAGAEANSRFRVPIVPLCAILAGVGLPLASRFFRRRPAQQSERSSGETRPESAGTGSVASG